MPKLAIKLGLIIVICISLTALFFYRDYQQFKQTPLTLSEPQIIIIAPGSSFDTVNQALLERGLLDNSLYMRLLARESGHATRLKAGEYDIAPGVTPTSLLDLLVSGQVRQYSLTLVEGWNIREVLAALEQDPVLIKTLDYSQTDKLMANLGFEPQSPEGLFFPDTYYFPRGTTDKEFLKRAYQRLQSVLQEEWSNRAENLPYNTPYEALIMASIVEKETG
ncbi:MAG: endolytic transglycosylase MltG, partial [Gammaproteobacteria bacterium]